MVCASHLVPSSPLFLLAQSCPLCSGPCQHPWAVMGYDDRDLRQWVATGSTLDTDMVPPSTRLVNWAALCFSCSCSPCEAMSMFCFPPGRCMPLFVWDGAKAFASLFRQLTLAWHSYDLHPSVFAGPLWPWPYSYSCAIGVAWPKQRNRKNSLIWQMKNGRLKWGATDSSASSGLKTAEHAIKGLWMDILLGAPVQGAQLFTRENRQLLYSG